MLQYLLNPAGVHVVNFENLIFKTKELVQREKALHVEIIQNLKILYENRVHHTSQHPVSVAFLDAAEMCKSAELEQVIRALRITRQHPISVGFFQALTSCK